MEASAVRRSRLAPGASAASVVSALFLDEYDRDAPLVALPRPEIHLGVRFGPSVPGGLDVHAMGGRQRAHRKLIRAGQRVVMARLHLGATEAVLGVPAAALTGRVVALGELWGDDATRRLCERLAGARGLVEAAAVVEGAIAERVALAGARRARPWLVGRAAERLASATVSAVAADLGVSERHLRRVFGEAVGMSPKAFARVARFRLALRAARGDGPANWAGIAAATGYYDQAHLIEEFRAIAGATPRALLGELA